MTLWALTLLAIACAGLLHLLDSPARMRLLDGSIGMALGLDICAHPAANMVNMLFSERSALCQSTSSASMVQWLALNLVVI
jgi:hypothetical protein